MVFEAEANRNAVQPTIENLLTSQIENPERYERIKRRNTSFWTLRKETWDVHLVSFL